ncbi:hypothetical protein F4781DRAFT_69817 [Annulohypoxylon bovei var. microspora]|nr:hypothetical protein F4781DRAFT_69817 [Annulohypoxylon bovei var. microspora]
MAHLAPSHQAAIFSPSVARAAASTAKDWSYVDSWLRSKYASNSSSHRRPPTFERNPETLKALLALAAANEAADEDRQQLARLEEAALAEVEASERDLEVRRQQPTNNTNDTIDGELLASDLIAALEANLSREGAAALDAMSAIAVDLGVAYPTPEILGAKYVEIQGRAVELEDSVERVNLLQRYLDRSSAETGSFLEELRGGEAYQPAPDLAKQNLELQRKIKCATGKLPELKQQVVALEKTVGLPGLTVGDVREDEEAYLELLARKKDLDARVKAFACLSPDIEAARAELEVLRAELRDATERRDANFEQLVERESPVKSRKRF